MDSLELSVDVSSSEDHSPELRCVYDTEAAHYSKRHI